MATNVLHAETSSFYDRTKELQEFDNTKAGVKGLVDAGVDKIPTIFIHAPQDRPKPADTTIKPHELQVPVIDLRGIDHEPKREEIVAQVLDASQEWGFFQIVNHGLPVDVLDEVLEGLRRFNELPKEVKMKLYTRDRSQKVKFMTNYDLFESTAANWRDTLSVSFNIGPFDPQDLPDVCRDIIMDYANHIKKLAEKISELLSDALGLPRHYLKETNGFESLAISGHYSPPCPQPDLTLATTRHTDPSFLSIVLQDHIGGLQVLHQDHWVDIKPIHGALVVNIGDILQLITNNKFKSVNHRVLAKNAGPRISIACFINPDLAEQRLYGPINELLSDENPPIYREVTIGEFLAHFLSKRLDHCNLDNFMI